jgi:hypothetical protein
LRLAGGQEPDTLWTRTYGGSNDDQAYSIRQTADKGYILAGWTASFGSQGTDIYMVRTDSIGDTLWTRKYGGSGEEMAFCIAGMPDQGFVLGGFTSSVGAGDTDLYIMRIASNGDTMWTRTYGGLLSDEALSLHWDEGGIIAAGYTCSYGSGGKDMYIIRLDDTGDSVWAHAYGGAGDEIATSICATPDSNFLIVGHTSSFGSGDRDWWLLKIDTQGDTIWTQTYGGINDEFAFRVKPTTDSNFIVCGTGYWILYDYEMVIIKINPRGDTIWRHCNGSLNYDYAHAVLENHTKNGFTVFGNFSYELYYLGLNSIGHSIWSKFVGGNGIETAHDAVATTDHGYAICGTTNSNGAGGFDFYLIKTMPDNTGIESSVATYSNNDLMIYPSPARDCINIRFSISERTELKLELSDISGRILRKDIIIHGPGTHLINFSVKALNPGVYFILVSCGGQRSVKKILVAL